MSVVFLCGCVCGDARLYSQSINAVKVYTQISSEYRVVWLVCGRVSEYRVVWLVCGLVSVWSGWCVQCGRVSVYSVVGLVCTV